MNTKLTFLLIFFLTTTIIKADDPINRVGKKLKAESFDISIFNNQYYFPFLGMTNIISAKYHPGISVGYTRKLKEVKKRTLYLDLKLGLYNHRFIQTGVQLYGDIGYRFSLPGKFFITTDFGLGYLHSIKHQTTFKSDGNGNYTKVKNFGRPQLMTGIGIGFGKQLVVLSTPVRLYIKYHPWFQMPFINSYVPLLPNNSMHLGLNINLKG